MKRELRRAWRSPALMSWLQLSLRLVSTAVILGLVLARFDAAAVNVWLMLMTLIGLQGVTDAGFSQTFARMYGYALSGSSIDELRDLRAVVYRGDRSPARETIVAVAGTARRVHLLLASAWVAVLLVGGSWAMASPIGALSAPSAGWLAWFAGVAASAVWVYGSQYVSLLQGTENVHVEQRIWASINAVQLLAVGGTLLLGGGLVALSVAYHACLLAQIYLYRRRARRILRDDLGAAPKGRFDGRIVAAIWPSAWRSGVGVLAASGMLPLSGIAYAQLTTPAQSASYLLVLRLVNVVRSFSAAPFQAYVPRLVRYRADGDVRAQTAYAQTKMRQSYAVCVAGGLAVGLLAPPLLEIIGSSTEFVPASFWALFLGGLLLQRYIGMHTQLYGTTNQIVWHWVNGSAAGMFLVLSTAMFPLIGAYAFPVAFVTAQLVFPLWYAAWCSYGALDVSPWTFERSVLPVPLLIAIVYIGVSLAGRLA